MKPAPFKLVRPETLADACEALVEFGEDARVLAGGQSLVPTMNFRLSQPTVLVDLARVEGLDAIDRQDGDLAVGAMVRQSEAGHSELIKRDGPLVAAALPWIGHVQIRNRGTVGGSIAHADPAAELPAVALAVDARLLLVSAQGERIIASRGFFEGPFMTMKRDDEVLAGVLFPVNGEARVSVRELARRHGDFAIAGVAVAVELSDNVVANAGIGAFGISSTPVRLEGVESGLKGRRLDAAAIREAARGATAEPERVTEDTQADAAYRRELLGTLVGQALRDVARQAPSRPA